MRNAILISLSFLCFATIGLTQQTAITANVDRTADPRPDNRLRPPVLSMPVETSDGQGLVFHWAVLPLRDASFEYEFILSDDAGLPVFTRIVPTNEFRLEGPSYERLELGKKYRATVHTRVTLPDVSYVLDGSNAGITFGFSPDCTLPRTVEIAERGNTFAVITWDGMPAQAGKTAYKVRFKPEKGGQYWTEQTVASGLKTRITGLIPVVAYKVEVQKVCYWKDGSEILSAWVPAQIPEISQVTLPPFICGAPYTFVEPNCDSTNQVVDSNAVIDLVYYGGFPLEITQISSTVNQETGAVEWNGEGLIPLPFGEDKAVSVSFASIVVNLDNEVCSTRGIWVISDEPPNLPDLTPSNGYGNAQICVPPPSADGFGPDSIHSATGLPWDPYGFGPDGKYVKQPPYPGWQPGFPLDTTGKYDPNGFDKDGINVQTGTLFNPNGCDRNGLDSLGQPCDPNIPPYSWMDSTGTGPESLAGLQFAAAVEDSMNFYLTQILNTLDLANTALLNAKADQCDSIRAAMTTNVNLSGVSPSFFFGADNEYFAPGMHENFTSPPVPLIPGSYMPGMRKESIKQLENQHIALYDCDKAQYVFVHIHEIITAYLGPDLPDLKALLLEKIRHLPEETITKFINNHALFLTWLTDKVKLEVDYAYIAQYGAPGTGYLEQDDDYGSMASAMPAKNLPASAAQNNLSSSNYLASTDLAPELLEQAATLSPEDIKFEFLQGFHTINGVSRAFYLEAIAGARRRAGSAMTQANPTYQPIELLTTGADGKGYRVYLDNIQFNFNAPATADAFIIIDLPFNGQRIVFEAHNIEFTPHGLLTSEGVKLQLGTDIPIRLSNNARMILRAGDHTYVAMNCLGYAGMGIAADVELCRNIVKPIDPATKNVLPEPEMVKGHFITALPDLSTLFVQFTVDPFVITGAEDVKWNIDTITLDLSETMSPTGTPTPGYQTPLAGPSGFTPLWKGFHARSIEVTMPAKFRKDKTPLMVGVHDLMIDNMGVSCEVLATNLLPLNQGTADGWGFSIDTFDLVVLMSNFSKAEFDGKIHVPLFRDSTNTSNTLTAGDCFLYEALIKPGSGDGGSYQFTIRQQSGVKYTADMWKAGSVTLDASVITLDYHDNRFDALANVSGFVRIAPNLTQSIQVNIPPITFQGVKVSNRAPYFSPGTWGFPLELGVKFAGFELGMRDIKMVETADMEPALSFDAYVQISDDTTMIKATGGFQVVGQLDTAGGEQYWRYKKLRIMDVDIKGSFTGVKYLHGFAKFFEADPVFGTGFRGGLEAQFDIMDAEISVVGQFGRVNGFKYFMVDAMYCGSIPVVGVFELTGIGGGAYYHMSRPEHAVSFSACNNPIPTQLGASLSGIVYQPTDTVLLGLKLTVAGGTTSSKEAFNANATIEFQFGSGFSLQKVWFYGNAKFMAPLNLEGLPTFVKDQMPNNNAALSANVDIVWDIQKSVFDGQLETYMDVAGVLKGGDPTVQNRLCVAKIRFAPDGWYIKIGGTGLGANPVPRMKIIAVIPGMSEPLFSLSSYLQLGSKVDAMPPLPQEIIDMGNISQEDQRGAAVPQGQGFAFGMEVKMGGHFKFLVLYADLSALMGTDLSITKSNIPLLCNGHEYGINGWYAAGQLYTRIAVDMGLEVKVFGSRKTFKILNTTIGAALEARLPNPFWARGFVAYKYELLGGLVKGAGNFNFELGEKCNFTAQGSVTELPVILDVKPGEGDKLQAVDTKPEVTFNFAVGEDFRFDELSGNSNVAYKITLDTAKLYYQGYTIPVEQLTWSADKRKLTIKPAVFLPGNDTIRLLVSVHIDSNGINLNRERRDIRFTTSSALRTIPPSNVKGSYPLNGQYNFYRNELTNNKGYIQLDRGQPDVFIGEEDKYIKVVRFRHSGGGCWFQKLEFTSDNYWDKKIEYELPSDGFLQAGEIYEMQILDFPKDDPNWAPNFNGPAPCVCNGCIPPPLGTPLPPYGGLLQPALAYNLENETPPPPPANPPAPPPGRTVYSAYFRVSEYATFADKMAVLATQSFKPNKETDAPDAGNVPFYIPDVITFSLDMEPFDWYDLRLETPSLGWQTGPGYNGSAPIWGTGVSNIYLDPILNPGAEWTFPDGQRLKSPDLSGLSWELPEPVSINAANRSGLRIGEEHFLGGLPAGFITTPQKLSIRIGEYLKTGTKGFINEFGALMTTENKEIVLESCTASPCDCDPSQWSTIQRLLCHNGQSGAKVYPLRFDYKLPGTDQLTGIYYVHFVR